MKVRVVTAAVAAVLLGAAPHHAASLTVFSAPAAQRPAGASPLQPVDAVLPDGKTAAPTGEVTFVGTHPLATAVSPDGRFALVANSGQRAGLTPPIAGIVAGYSLVSVATANMRVADAFHSDAVAFFTGLAAVRDPAAPLRTVVLASDGANNNVRFFDLASDGRLTLEPRSVAIAGYPGGISISPDGRTAYVAANVGGSVTAVDIANRAPLQTMTVGFFPAAVAASPGRILVANGGLAQYRAVAQPARAPQFSAPAADPYKSSSLSVVDTLAGGDVATTSPNNTVIRLDPVPDGIDAVGGAAPSAVAISPDRRYAYVALSNVDRVSIVSLAGTPRVADGLDLRLFPNAPYGTQPDAVAFARDGKRLYVALAGLNAVAVLDTRNPVRLHRLGLIPTGAYPSALSLSPDGRYLYVAAAQGVDGWGELQRVDLRTVPLMRTTLATLYYARRAAPARPSDVVPALRSQKRSSAIARVVYISVGTPSFDALFGDLQSAGDSAVNADPALALYGGNTSPNLRALASEYGVADNFYAADLNADANRQIALCGMPTVYTERTLPVNASRQPLDAHGEDPENYPRVGYLFNALSRAGLSYRDYGGLLSLSGFNPAAAAAPVRGRSMSPAGLGGSYGLDTPSLAALEGHADLNYPIANAQIGNLRRAQEFVNDMDRYVKAGAQPAFSYVWLPTDASRDAVAEADRSVGAIVDYLSHTPHWNTTAIFIAGDGVSGERDHVNIARSFAIVVSPYARRRYVGKNHLSGASILKTEEELLGLPSLSLNDLLATDLSDFFGTTGEASPYTAQP